MKIHGTHLYSMALFHGFIDIKNLDFKDEKIARRNVKQMLNPTTITLLLTSKSEWTDNQNAERERQTCVGLPNKDARTDSIVSWKVARRNVKQMLNLTLGIMHG